MTSDKRLRRLFGKPENWTSASENQIKIIVVYDSKEFPKLDQCVWENIVPTGHRLCSQHGVEFILCDALLNSCALKRERLTTREHKLLLDEIRTVAETSDSFYYLHVVGKSWGPLILPDVVQESDWKALIDIAVQINKDAIKHLERVYTPSRNGIKSYELIYQSTDYELCNTVADYFKAYSAKSCHETKKGEECFSVYAQSCSALLHMTRAALESNASGCIIVDACSEETEDPSTWGSQLVLQEPRALSHYIRGILRKNPGGRRVIVDPDNLLERLPKLLETEISLTLGGYKFCQEVSPQVRHWILSAQNTLRDHLAFEWKEPIKGIDDTIKSNLLAGSRVAHHAVLIEGHPVIGKTRTLVRALEVAWKLLKEDVIYIAVFLKDSPFILSLNDLVKCMCQCMETYSNSSGVQINYSMSLKPLDRFTSAQSTLSKASRHCVFLLDDFEALAERSKDSIEDQITWLSQRLSSKIHLFFTADAQNKNGKPLIDYWKGDTSLAKCVLPSVSQGDSPQPSIEHISQLAAEAFQRRKNGLALVFKHLSISEINSTSPEAVYSLAKAAIPENEILIGNPAKMIVNVTSNLQEGKSFLRYLAASKEGLTEGEALDLLSCDDSVFSNQENGSNVRIRRVAFLQWLEVRSRVAPLIRWQVRFGRRHQTWASQIASDTVRKMLMSTSTEVRTSHAALAFLFRDAWSGETRPTQTELSRIRYVGPQPLIYENTQPNRRRLGELWYQLLYNGDLSALKKYTFFDLNFILSHVTVWSAPYLSHCLQLTLDKVLDQELQLFAEGMRDYATLRSVEAKHLPGFLINRFRQIRDVYPSFEQLVHQSMEWFDTQATPLLMPLTSADIPLHIDTVATVSHPSFRGQALPTIGGQHVFCMLKDEVAMFHIASGLLIKTFTDSSQPSSPTCLALAAEGNWLLLGTEEGIVQVFNITTGLLVYSIDLHHDAIPCLCVTNSGDTFFSGSRDASVKRVHLGESSGEVLACSKCHNGTIIALVLNSKETLLVTGSADFKVKVWYTDDMSLLSVFEDFVAPVMDIALSQENAFLIIGCADGSLSVKCLTTGESIHCLGERLGQINSLRVTKKGYHVIVGCEDGHCYVYNLCTKNLQCVIRPPTNAGPILSVRNTVDGDYVVLLHSGLVRTINLNFGLHNNEIDLHQYMLKKPFECIRMSSDERIFATGLSDGTVNLWNFNDVTVSNSTSCPDNQITCIDLSLNVSRLVAGTKSGLCVVWDVETFRKIRCLEVHKSPLRQIHFLFDGTSLLSMDTSGKVLIWTSSSLATPMCLMERLPQDLVLLSPDRAILFVGSSHELLIWDLESRTIQQSETLTTPVSHAAFSREGQLLVAMGTDSTAKVWSAPMWNMIQILSDGDNTTITTSLAVSPICDVILSGNKSGDIIIWNIANGDVQQSIQAHRSSITGLEVSGDSRLLLSVSLDRDVCVWNINTGHYVAIFFVGAPVLRVLMTTTMNRILLRLEGCNQFSVLCLHNSPVDLSPIECSDVDEELYENGQAAAKPLLRNSNTAVANSDNPLPNRMSPHHHQTLKAQMDFRRKSDYGQVNYNHENIRRQSMKEQHSSQSKTCSII